MELFKNTVICGGTHGNELTGVYLAKKHGWLLANPEAANVCRRYINNDLNRCFALPDLQTNSMGSIEKIRAKEINMMLGGKGTENAPDLILDIHNTTANMGITLILSQNNYELINICAHIAKKFTDIHIYLQPEERNESPYLGTIARHDVCIEAGAQTHGTLNAELFLKVEAVIFYFLELIDIFNKGNLPKIKNSIETYTETYNIDYPRDKNGNITAMIHPTLQGRDFCELKAGMPIFTDFNGKEIIWEKEICHPAFINEAAYYEKGIAMSLTKRSVISL